MSADYSFRYSMTHDGLADLALSVDLEERLRDAWDIPGVGIQIQTEIEDRVNQHIAQHGINDATGEWYGEWSASEIVSDVLANHDVEIQRGR